MLKLEMIDCNSIFFPHYLVKSWWSHCCFTDQKRSIKGFPLIIKCWNLALHGVPSRNLRLRINFFLTVIFILNSACPLLWLCKQTHTLLHGVHWTNVQILSWRTRYALNHRVTSVCCCPGSSWPTWFDFEHTASCMEHTLYFLMPGHWSSALSKQSTLNCP